ncbi:MAG TPA: hypothetical protein VFG83_10220, partial [Kofleriaceae bacterium]|nr:hypothetical protein [Kofleriaceae bacterium]
MNRKVYCVAPLVALGIGSWPALAFAQQQPADDTEAQQPDEQAQPEGQRPGMVPSDELPPPREKVDPRPPVPVPSGPGKVDVAVIKQAGAGSQVSYARAGVLELGGSAGLSAADDLFRLSIEPSIGYFFFDNIELTAIAGLSFISENDAESTLFTALIEPSFHMPFTQTVFGFVGLGAGVAYADDPGVGFALAPRAGAKIMVGRSGVLTPAVQLRFNTHESIDGSSNLAVSTSLELNIGYT